MLRTRMPLLAAVLFAFYGTLAVLLLASQMPPYQNADEGAHFTRADQVSHLGLIARHDPRAPALIDGGVMEGAERFGPLTGHSDMLATRPLYAPLAWGERRAVGFANTEMYPPFLYIPAAIGTWAGRRLHFTVLPSLELARAASGLASVAIGAAAIFVSGPLAVWLFAVLSLPMALAQMAAVSQDGPMIACAALAAAALVRLDSHETRHPLRWLPVACLAFVLIGSARPPYVFLALLPLLAAARVPVRLRAACAGAGVALIVAWCVTALVLSRIDFVHYNNSDAGAQALGLLWPPWRLPVVLYRTLAQDGHGLVTGFIGILGWLDVPMPQTYVTAVAVVLGLAAASAGLAGGHRPALRTMLWAAAVLAAACVGLFVIQYLTWTPVGAPLVEGMQGRYFVPIALLAGAMLVPRDLSDSRAARVLAWPVLLFPIATIVVVMHRIVLRYYL